VRILPEGSLLSGNDLGWIDPRALDEDGKILSPRAMARYEGMLAWSERFDRKFDRDMAFEIGDYGRHGDFDGDGMSDIAWQNSLGNTSIWLMHGATVSSTGSLGLVPTTNALVLTGDFNGDGMSDLLWRDTLGNTSIWFMNEAQLVDVRARVPRRRRADLADWLRRRAGVAAPRDVGGQGIRRVAALGAQPRARSTRSITERFV
jgi:FG-GAP-like repeat